MGGVEKNVLPIYCVYKNYVTDYSVSDFIVTNRVISTNHFPIIYLTDILTYESFIEKVNRHQRDI